MKFFTESTEELMYILDGLRVLKSSYGNVRGVDPDEYDDSVRIINGLIKKIDPLVPNYNNDGE